LPATAPFRIPVQREPERLIERPVSMEEVMSARSRHVIQGRRDRRAAALVESALPSPVQQRFDALPIQKSAEPGPDPNEEFEAARHEALYQTPRPPTGFERR
jgi:hypothetical protein